MKDIWIKRTLSGCLMLGFALSFVVCFSNARAAGGTAVKLPGELEESRVASVDLLVGQIDSINQDSITIGDKGHRLTKTTHYRTKGGGVTQKNHFSVGDRVQYIEKSEGDELILVELRLKERPTAKKTSVKQNGGGKIQLKNGVWTN